MSGCGSASAPAIYQLFSCRSTMPTTSVLRSAQASEGRIFTCCEAPALKLVLRVHIGYGLLRDVVVSRYFDHSIFLHVFCVGFAHGFHASRLRTGDVSRLGGIGAQIVQVPFAVSVGRDIPHQLVITLIDGGSP